jgi:hypothetical protein
MKISTLFGAIVLISTALIMNSAAYAAKRNNSDVIASGPTIYVTSLGLYFDSIIVGGALPQAGNFQQLIPAMNGLETEFGPGQPGHLGGRWWIDTNADGIKDAEDVYFLCPLLGPGREAP